MSMLPATFTAPGLTEEEYFAGPDGSFLFPNGARREPDAAWVDKKRWQAAQKPGLRVPVFAPEFVIEEHSPEQRPLAARKNGRVHGQRSSTRLIDPPIARSRSIAPEVLNNPKSVAGEGPVSRFVLRLDEILRLKWLLARHEFERGYCDRTDNAKPNWLRLFEYAGLAARTGPTTMMTGTWGGILKDGSGI